MNGFGWDTNIDYREIIKLATLLQNNNIPHEIRALNYGLQVVIYDADKNILDDAVLSPMSYGAKHGLLETYELSDCEGYETAQEVFDGWNEKYWGLAEYHGLTEC